MTAPARGAAQSSLEARAGEVMPAAPAWLAQQRRGVSLRRVAGLREGWTLPVAEWHAPSGFDTTTDPEVRSDHVIAFRLGGALVRRVDRAGRTVESLPRAGFSTHPAGRELRFVAQGEIRYAHVLLPAAVLRQLWVQEDAQARRGEDPIAAERTMWADRALRDEVAAYLARAFATGTPSRLEMDCRATLLMIGLLRACGDPRAAAPARQRGGLAAWQLRRVQAAIEERLAENLALAELAALVGLSPWHFCRAFRESTGLPPQRWQLARRVERACLLLETTALPVSEIAAAVGYDDPSQLAALFRRCVGLSPARYRRERQA